MASHCQTIVPEMTCPVAAILPRVVCVPVANFPRIRTFLPENMGGPWPTRLPVRQGGAVFAGTNKNGVLPAAVGTEAVCG